MDAACFGVLSQISSMVWKEDAMGKGILVCCKNQQLPTGFLVKQVLYSLGPLLPTLCHCVFSSK